MSIPYTAGPANFAAALVARSGTPGQTVLASFKEYLGTDPADTREDGAMSISLNAVGAMIESYLDRVVVARSVTESYEHYFGTVILSQAPAAGPVTVTADAVDVSADYTLYRDRAGAGHLSRLGMRHDIPMDWRAYAQVDVTYTGGWASIPEDLTYALLMSAGDYYGVAGTGTVPGGTAAGTGDIKQLTLYDVGSVSYDVGAADSGTGGTGSGIIPAKALAILGPYRRYSA